LQDDPPVPGVSLDAVRWMHKRGVSLYAGDIGDARPPLSPGAPAPLHKVALVRLGMPLIDAADLEGLAAVCARLSRYSFLLSVAPPRILGMTGVPVNPLAIFYGTEVGGGLPGRANSEWASARAAPAPARAFLITTKG
jgi:kynurenine formamidase